MKRTTLIITLILVCCFSAFAQNRNQVSKVESDPADRYGKCSYNDNKASLDNLFIEVINYPNLKALIDIQFNKMDSRNYKTNHLKDLRKIIKERNYDLSKTLFVISDGEYEETVLWFVPQGAQLPEIKSKNYQIIEGKRLQQQLKILFPKK